MTLLFSLLLLILPNSVFWLLSAVFSVDRPLFNLDYLFVSILLFLPKRWPALSLFAIFFVIDLLTLVSQIFIFVNLAHLAYLSKFILLAPTAYQLFVCLVILALMTLLNLLPKLAKHAALGSMLVIFNLGLLVYFAEKTQLEPELERVYLIQHKIIGSATLHNVEARSTLFFQLHREKDNYLLAADEQAATTAWQTHLLPEQMLLVINESWGLHRNAKVQQAIIDPLLELTNEQLIEIKAEGALGFKGATVNGELKELCQLSAKNFNLKKLHSGFENCLPNKFAEHGYYTHALHAASGVLYDRIHWYPRAGFKKTTFFEDHLWQRRCFSYPGACDYEAIHLITEAFNTHPRLFFYWLTLNTHANYDKRDVIFHEFDCNAFDIQPASQTCRNLVLQKQFFMVLANTIKNGSFSGAEIIIVADHEPIISNLQEKAENFETGLVPWIHVKVR